MMILICLALESEPNTGEHLYQPVHDVCRINTPRKLILHLHFMFNYYQLQMCWNTNTSDGKKTKKLNVARMEGV